ncbi:MAG: hypothetical protein RIA10_06105 [Amphiplicatus sp.]
MRQAKLVFVACLMILAGGCAKMTLAWADLSGGGPDASPPLFADETPTAEDWETKQAPARRAAFEDYVYGAMPDASSTEIISHRTIDAAAFGGAGVLEEYELVASATFGGETRSTKPFFIDVLAPAGASGPVPVIMMESFCPRTSTIPHAGVARLDDGDFCQSGEFMSGLMTYVFGRYIATPPVETILARGYAIAALYPSEAVPDSSGPGLEALAALSAGHADDETRWGAVAAWGWLFSRAVDVLETDERLDNDGFVAWGHSRYGKAALVAAAWDKRIDAVIAHQSGTGGASLNRRKKGESVGAITRDYPHWFSARYAEMAGREAELPVDQHELLALIAPRPVFLGNARRDVWSDPNGAFRAAKAASPAYALYGSNGLDQERLDRFNPQADLSFWIRPGTHGVVKEDWPAFLEFLDARYKAPKS